MSRFALTLRLGACAAAAVALAAASPAAASVVTYTFTGTVKSGVDFTGVFGDVGQDLTGFAFKAAFVRDESGWNVGFTNDPQFTSVASLGPPGAIHGAITINGGTRSVSGNIFAQQSQSKSPTYEGFDLTSVDVADVPNEPAFQDVFLLDVGASGGGGDDLASVDYHTLSNLTAATTPSLSWYGDYQIARYPTNTTDEPSYLTKVSLDPTELVVSSDRTSGAPEPAAWGLMLVGFGLAGAALRRRHSQRA